MFHAMTKGQTISCESKVRKGYINCFIIIFFRDHKHYCMGIVGVKVKIMQRKMVKRRMHIMQWMAKTGILCLKLKCELKVYKSPTTTVLLLHFQRILTFWPMPTRFDQWCKKVNILCYCWQYNKKLYTVNLNIAIKAKHMPEVSTSYFDKHLRSIFMHNTFFWVNEGLDLVTTGVFL